MAPKKPSNNLNLTKRERTLDEAVIRFPFQARRFQELCGGIFWSGKTEELVEFFKNVRAEFKLIYEGGGEK